MMAAGKKKPEEKNARPPGSKRSQMDAAEKKHALMPKNSPGLKGQTTERLVSGLQEHRNEIGTIAEDLLKSSESRYRRFFEAVRDGILIIDAETGTILDVNPFLIELLGFTHEQFLGKKLWEIGVFKDIAASKDNFKKLQEKKYIRFENLPLETADGRRIYAEFVSFVYEVDDTEVMQCNIRDITERKKAEEVLKSSESRYRRFFEAVRDGILIIDAKTGTILDVNPFLIELLGFTHEQFLGKKLWEIGVFKDIAASKDNFKKLQEKKYIRFENLPLETADGRRIYAEFVSFVYEVDDTEVMQCNIRDITERKKAEERLRETRDYLENLIDYANAPIIVWDKKFRITRFNHAFENLAGISQEEVIGKDLEILFPEATKEESLTKIRQTAAGEHWEVVEIPILHTSGKTYTVLWNSAAIHNPAGDIISTIAQGQDITERKRAEERLRETRDYLENLIDYANAPIIVWDKKFRITRFNHAFENLAGISQEEVIGKDLEILFPEATKEESLTKIRQTAAGEHWEVVEIPILHTSGKTYTVLWNSAAIHNPAGDIISTIAQGQDITERKQMEAELKRHSEKLEQTVSERTRELRDVQDQLVKKEKLAILGKLAGGVGHELRNPLGAIKNAAYFLDMALEKPDPDVKEMIKLINKEVARSEDIISSLLDFARPKTLTLTKEVFTTAVNEALKRNPIPDHVTVINNLDETLPRILADQDKLLQVFNNIISNAFQAMPGGGSLTITSKQPDPEWVSISFTDTGEGISAENMKKLFEPLFTTKIKGIGLGMVVSKNIVELHGGHIDVRSKAGKGTTVTVNLPMGVAKEV